RPLWPQSCFRVSCPGGVRDRTKTRLGSVEGRSRLLESSQHVDRVESPGRLLLVFEIREHLALASPLAEGALDSVDLRSGVLTLAESVAGKGCGHHIRRLQIIAFGDAERGSIVSHHVVHVIAEPRCVPKLEGHAQPITARICKERGEARHVGLEVGRKLNEHDSHLPCRHYRSQCTRENRYCLGTVLES